MEIIKQLGMDQGTGGFGYILSNPFVLVLLIAWILAWKGWALWKAARLSHKWWFVIILFVNTLGILEIIYIYFIARKYTIEADTETK